MTYRDDREALQARVETLEQELAGAQATIARLEGRGAADVGSESASTFLGTPMGLRLERELPFEVTNQGFEAIAELLRSRRPQFGQGSQVGRKLTYRNLQKACDLTV